MLCWVSGFTLRWVFIRQKWMWPAMRLQFYWVIRHSTGSRSENLRRTFCKFWWQYRSTKVQWSFCRCIGWWTGGGNIAMCCTVPWQLASWAQHIRLWRGAWQICCPMRWQNILRRATAEWNPLRLVRFMLCWLPLFFTKWHQRNAKSWNPRNRRDYFSQWRHFRCTGWTLG